jgi:hypothetical protein|tara:strand:+ start:564 stop:773 length:210 start_codon:yes stop_codon:yes gene_type:complete
MSKVRKIIKVLAKKASGLGRKAKLAEMKKGLMALDLVRMQSAGIIFPPVVSKEDIDAVGVLLDRASVRR